MKIISSQILTIPQALKEFGGHVRYYAPTESSKEILNFIKSPINNALCCCGSGDQVITLLTTLRNTGYMFALDTNPAQLFILAAKAEFISRQKKLPPMPSFENLCKKYPKIIFPQPKDLRTVEGFYDLKNKRFISIASSFPKSFAFECDGGMFNRQHLIEPFWSKNIDYIRRIKDNIHRLRFLHANLLYLNTLFPNNFFDLIYISDITFLKPADFYAKKLSSVLKLLMPGGIIIGNSDSGEKYTSNCQSAIDILRRNERSFKLKIFAKKDNLYALKKLT
jgi:hypothetical protein